MTSLNVSLPGEKFMRELEMENHFPQNDFLENYFLDNYFLKKYFPRLKNDWKNGSTNG